MLVFEYNRRQACCEAQQPFQTTPSMPLSLSSIRRSNSTYFINYLNIQSRALSTINYKSPKTNSQKLKPRHRYLISTVHVASSIRTQRYTSQPRTSNAKQIFVSLGS